VVSLPSGGLGHLWRRFDCSLLALIARIRSAEHPGPQDTAIITLPIRLGGMGVLSFDTCAPLASQAAAESADLVLTPLLSLNHQEATESIISRSGPIRSEEFDINVVSLASQAALAAALPSQVTQHLVPLQLATQLAHKHLDSFASTNRRLKPALDAPRPSRHRPFTRLVLSWGGLMESGTTDALQL